MIRYNEIHETSTGLPKNVRQIGELQEGHRIYIEDYAYTFLHQYADNKEEQVAFLIGQRSICEDESILLIRGVVKGKFLNRDGSNAEITEETMVDAHDMKEQYFPEEEIVGWIYTQPSYGVILTSFLVQQHQQFFPQEGQVLIVLDPVEKDEVFFEFQEGELVQRQGFFVYYEKNPSMHEYMLDHKIAVETTDVKVHEDRAVKHYRVKEQEKKDDLYHRKFVNMLFALSGALVILCIIIGVGLINNLEETNQLKKSLNIVMADYGNFKSGDTSEDDLHIDEESQTALSTEASTLPPNNNDVADEVQQIETTQESTQIETTQVSTQVQSTQQVVQVNETLTMPETYIVQTGDSLIKISYRFYSTKSMVPIIQEANGIEDSDRIYIGEVLILPKVE